MFFFFVSVEIKVNYLGGITLSMNFQPLFLLKNVERMINTVLFLNKVSFSRTNTWPTISFIFVHDVVAIPRIRISYKKIFDFIFNSAQALRISSFVEIQNNCRIVTHEMPIRNNKCMCEILLMFKCAFHLQKAKKFFLKTVLRTTKSITVEGKKEK